MKLAFISDIHANLPALEATLAGLDSQRPDAIYCLGDLVNQNVWNNEVVEIIRQRGIATVRGNHDEGIGTGKSRFRFSYTFPEARQWGLEAIAYTLANIKPENRSFLAGLPFSLRLSIRHRSESPFTLLLVHGGPRSIDDTLFRHLPAGQYRQYLDAAGSDVLVCGQAHVPYHYRFADEDKQPEAFRHVLCPGSVGKPQDGDWRASYLMLTLDVNKNLRSDPTALQVDFFRVSYDLEKAVKAIKKSKLSTWYGSCLITG
ncbi:MAG TPA: metallophosphoesterase family protein [Puia sp.]|uniref:metallophosphoesterase family protein n=1 Tax=Puia sp. TaxID=2045100 RepID=UPI002B9793D3|nr:metallophosphoesterase family protein [Puia sp.]HVU93682.1 metallophosphoesterase family protein [Puia sp.]